MINAEIHIDISIKYNQSGHSIIGYVDKRQPLNRQALIIKDTIKKELGKKFRLNSILNQFHAAIIFILLNKKIKHAEKIIICNDYNYDAVMDFLSVLYGGNKKYISKFMSLSEYRAQINNPKFKSHADRFVKKVCRTIKKRNNMHKRSEVMDNCKFITNQDLQSLLDYINIPHESKKLINLCTVIQQNLYN